MKILLVLEATLGGAGRHVVDLANGLLERDHDVHLIYSLLRADGHFKAGLERLQSSHPRFRGHSIAITRELTASDIRAYLQLWRLVGKHGPFDIIHSHSTKAGFLSRLIVGRRGAQSVYTPHGLMTMDPRLRGGRRLAVCALEAVLSRFCSGVVVVSWAERACALRTGIWPRALVVIPNGIDKRSDGPGKRDEIRARLGLKPDEVCIGWVGRLTEYKCPDRVLESFALLTRRSRKPMRLVMIGWGPLEEISRRQATDLQIADKVLFLGEVDGPGHMPAFDVLAHTSYFEGFAYVFLEALNSGVPIVTTRVGATNELIEESVTGHVCEPWGADRFARMIDDIADHPERRAAMARAARERASRYSARSMVDSTVALYESLSPQRFRVHGKSQIPSRSVS